MYAAFISVALTASLAPSVDLPTLFWGIDPPVLVVEADTRLKARHERAVVLVHGLLPRVWHPDRAEKPEAHDWRRRMATTWEGSGVISFEHSG